VKKQLFVFLMALLCICFAGLSGEEVVETKHKITLGGVEIAYRAVAGTLPIKEGDKIEGELFYVAYLKEGEQDNPQRPLTFCFNGGPGTCSVWLHLGAFGPQRIALSATGVPLTPNRLEENESSLLDQTDLVFVDTISTGYSREAQSVEAKEFHAVDKDIDSLAQFVRLYTTRERRWLSPKYLIGESYGTIRAIELALKLHDGPCLFFNGLVLISPILNYQTISFDESNDLPYALFFPSYTLAAWYHQRLSEEHQRDFEATLQESKRFADNDYLLALAKGDQLTSDEKSLLAEKIAKLTGLSAAYVEKNNLRVEDYRFSRELLADKNRFIGRFDSRIEGIHNAYDPTDYAYYDPSLEGICGAFAATFHQYAREQLKWERETEYTILANVNPWDFGKRGRNRYFYVGDTLREVMTKNPTLKVFIASGYYDLATPIDTGNYSIDHLNLDPSLKRNIGRKTYKAGHMIYLDKEARLQLRKDLSQFFSEGKNRATP
jgi:carboxypeptidase C (cathepsin A)